MADAGPRTVPSVASTKGIQRIEKSSVHRICSGQVILDPSSALKELVENSVDAGATKVEVRLKEYGLESLEVVDDGSGVKPEDYEILAKKHTTSKLSSFADLAKVNTFGFRGEALSSLCAICEKVVIVTRTSEQMVGTKLEYDGHGALGATSNCAREVGTTVTLLGLFHNLPVRLKDFQKNKSREFQRLLRKLQAYAIIHCDVRITCKNSTSKSNSVVLSTPGNKKLLDGITSVFGAKMKDNLIELSLDCPGEVAVKGLISKASAGCGLSSGDRQFLFLNKRPVDVPKLTKAINEIYKSYNMHQFPMYFLNITMSTAAYDVNVTPDKRTVMFHDEKRMVEAVREQLKEFYEPSRGTMTIQSFTMAKPKRSRDDVAPSIGADDTEDEGEDEGKSQPQSTASSQEHASSSSSFSSSSLPCPSADSPARSAASRREGGLGGPGSTSASASKRQAASCDATERAPPAPSSARQVDAPDAVVLTQMLLPAPRAREGRKRVVRAVDEEEEEKEEVDDVVISGEETAAGHATKRRKEAGDEEAEGEGAVQEQEACCPSQRRGGCGQGPVGGKEERAGEGGEAARRERLRWREEEAEDVGGGESGRGTWGGGGGDARPQKQRRAGNGAGGGEERGELASESGVSAEEEGGGRRTPKQAQREASGQEQEEASMTTPEGGGGGGEDGEEGCMDAPEVLGGSSFEVAADWAAIMASQQEHLRRAGEAEAGWGNAAGERGSGGRVGAEDAAGDLSLRKVAKEDFGRMEVLGQFNLGFIIARLGPDIYILDQHACDEKYRFETLQQTTAINSQRLVVPHELNLEAPDEMVVEENLDIFLASGFDLEVRPEQPAGQRVRLRAVPFSKGTVFGASDVHEMLCLLRDNPGVPCRPSRISAMFASRACRSAIMIGTALSVPQMEEVKRHMGTMEQPWNCPHGRPTMRHLYDLTPVRANAKRAAAYSYTGPAVVR